MTSRAPAPAVVLFVGDVARLTTFYQEVAQMRVLHQERGYAVLAINGLELVIHGIPMNGAAADPSEAVQVREDSYWKLCLPVARLADARDTVKRLGGDMEPPAKEWSARGFRACDGHDPEGNVIQLREADDQHS